MATASSVPAESDGSSPGQLPCDILFPPCTGVKIKAEPDNSANLDGRNIQHSICYSDAGVTPKSDTSSMTGSLLLEALISSAITRNLVPVKEECMSLEELLPELGLSSQPPKDVADKNMHEQGETSQSGTYSWSKEIALEATEITTGTSLLKTMKRPAVVLSEKDEAELLKRCMHPPVKINTKRSPDGAVQEDEWEPPESDKDVTQMLWDLQKQNTCPVCQRKFHNASSLRTHMNIHNGERKFKCTECGAGFKDKTTLKTHTLIHSAVKPFKCSMCPSTQCTKSGLQQHVARTHSSGANQVVCNICGKCFRDKNSLRKHVERHTGKNILCTVCGKLFYTEKHLKTHIAKTHELTTNDTPDMFQCEHCNRVYGYKVTLANHILHVHLQVRPYECFVCHKKFAAKAQIHQHMVVNHSKEKFTCNCGRSFSTKASFYRHCLTHINYRPYTCDMCGLTFTQKSSVERHIITNMEKQHFKRFGTCKPITGGRGGFYAVNDIY